MLSIQSKPEAFPWKYGKHPSPYRQVNYEKRYGSLGSGWNSPALLSGGNRCRSFCAFCRRDHQRAGRDHARGVHSGISIPVLSVSCRRRYTPEIRYPHLFPKYRHYRENKNQRRALGILENRRLAVSLGELSIKYNYCCRKNISRAGSITLRRAETIANLRKEERTFEKEILRGFPHQFHF